MFTERNVASVARMLAAAEFMHELAKSDPSESEEVVDLTLQIAASLHRLQWRLEWEKANQVAPPRLFR